MQSSEISAAAGAAVRPAEKKKGRLHRTKRWTKGAGRPPSRSESLCCGPPVQEEAEKPGAVRLAAMETDGEQNQQGASTNGSSASGASSRPSPMNSMSLYERQAVQALQALQRQPNAAQYFQQLMLQQQINSAQLQNLAAVQQVKATLAASRQSSPSSSSSSQTTSTTAASVTSGSGSTASSRPLGTSTTSTISQSVLLSGTAGGQGQMYLRVNRSLRAPIPSQLIFMPGSTATAAVATVAQQPQTQQQQEGTPASSSSSQSDNEQAQNLAMRGVSSPKGVGVKTEAQERTAYSLVQPSHQSTPQSPAKPTTQPTHIKIPSYPQPTNLKAHPSSSSSASSSSSSSTSSIPLSQLLLHGTRTLTTGSAAPTAAHALVLTSNATSQPHGYPVGTATIKPGVNAQTLVVQPLQKTSLGAEKSGHGNGPIPIQPKTLQGLRLPLQLPSRNPPPILPAPPPASSSAQPSQPPHIPVQIVGARQSTLGSTQALALARGSCNQEGAAILSSSSSLLTMVASIASREGGVVGRGVGLKTLQSSQEAPPLAQVSQVHPQANQSSGQRQNGPLAPSLASSQAPTVSSPPSMLSHPSLSLPLVTEEQRASSGAVTTNGDSLGDQTPQGKQMAVSLKRKSDSNPVNDENGPSPPRLQPIRDHVSASPTNSTGAGSGSPPPASSSPALELSVSRGACNQGERAPPPQAVVKPQVLTHLIEGFVIQEGAEPFPMCGTVKDSAGEDLTNDSPDTNQSEIVTTATVLKCEYCKNFAPASQFRGTKRFCSMSCAKSMYWFPRYNVSFRQPFSVRQGHSQRQDQDHTADRDQGHGHISNSDEEGGIGRRRVPRRTSSEIASAKIAGRPIPVKCRLESSHSEEESTGEEDEDDPLSLSPASSASCHQPPPPPIQTESSAPSCLSASPAQWSVEEVSQFISSLQGCEELASQFLSQEIDGQALLLLKEEHLMSTMNIKLGPALKICAHINNLKD
ncbi:polyhomeotic-like protein 1 isoform X2 [Melanotaenia boesemani]|uniref:polyhomeotic-like protein 1 isoform X2 n=1 Tax=Melanotaenia boesemani TaxID=1250792 RepID=UPI001C0555CB|nr:polyhomeotic-like protein 1 isoform X2 [Melanotaenia boesemani]